MAFNSNKDKTDFELALNHLEGVDKSIIYIIGGESGAVSYTHLTLPTTTPV